jgi:hypothetical protein
LRREGGEGYVYSAVTLTVLKLFVSTTKPGFLEMDWSIMEFEFLGMGSFLKIDLSSPYPTF